MNENLSQMVKDTTPPINAIFSEADLDIPEEEMSADSTPVSDPDVPVDTVEETPAESIINITPLSTWFEANSDAIPNINQVKVVIRGINANQTLIMAVKNADDKVDEDGNDKRTLRVFDNADNLPVLNIPPVSMDVYNNGFCIIHQVTENILVKTYSVRTGLICTFCTVVDGKLIPYTIVRAKKTDTELTVIDPPETDLSAKLAANANLESLQLLYKQSIKTTDELTTNQTVVDWLLKRQDSVTDINHHLQIDNVLIDILK